MTETELLKKVFSKLREWRTLSPATTALKGRCICDWCKAQVLFDFYGILSGGHEPNCVWEDARAVNIVGGKNAGGDGNGVGTPDGGG